uniref:Uncharacterized protein n=1 Tax=Theropithecus gelada TaxID=9565 RepID=A0A8D2JY43_THEGE
MISFPLPQPITPVFQSLHESFKNSSPELLREIYLRVSSHLLSQCLVIIKLSAANPAVSVYWYVMTQWAYECVSHETQLQKYYAFSFIFTSF